MSVNGADNIECWSLVVFGCDITYTSKPCLCYPLTSRLFCPSSCSVSVNKATSVKFGVMLRTWDSVRLTNFVFNKSLNGIAPLGTDLYQKVHLLMILAGLSP